MSKGISTESGGRALKAVTREENVESASVVRESLRVKAKKIEEQRRNSEVKKEDEEAKRMIRVREVEQ